MGESKSREEGRAIGNKQRLRFVQSLIVTSHYHISYHSGNFFFLYSLN